MNGKKQRTTLYRWQAAQQTGRLLPVKKRDLPSLADLLGLDSQRNTLLKNTRAFAAGLAANHALCWGARGTGKSSLIKAVYAQISAEYKSLNLVEIAGNDLAALPLLLEKLGRKKRALIFVDDLSFEASDRALHGLKTALEGSLAAPGGNVVLYATSNRRHLVPETHADNAAVRLVDGELHEGEAIDSKIALADRFGLWLAFYPFTQDNYLTIARYWVKCLGGNPHGADLEARALAWSRQRASTSGRTARQFAIDYCQS